MSGSGGQVRQRKSGLWEGRFIGADHRRHSVYAKTKAEAQQKMRAALTAADHGVRPAGGRLTVGAWLEEWLTTSVEPHKLPRTAESYRETVARYIVPSIGRDQLARLEPADVARMLETLKRRGDLSPSTIRYAHSVLRIALGRAMKVGKVVRNVASLVEPPAKVRQELHPLTADQVRAFLASVAEDRLGPLYETAVATGMRQGELLALRWSDVDLDTGKVTVRHTLRRGVRTLAEPKTETSKRTLHIGSVAVTLRAHRTRQLEERIAAGRRWQDGDFVFATKLGEPLDTSTVTRSFQAALRRAGLPRQRFHDLRHACATLHLEAGEELIVVSRLLGHSTISTTADVYAHVTPAMLDRTVARMDGILGRTDTA